MEHDLGFPGIIPHLHLQITWTRIPLSFEDVHECHVIGIVHTSAWYSSSMMVVKWCAQVFENCLNSGKFTNRLKMFQGEKTMLIDGSKEMFSSVLNPAVQLKHGQTASFWNQEMSRIQALSTVYYHSNQWYLSVCKNKLANNFNRLAEIQLQWRFTGQRIPCCLIDCHYKWISVSLFVNFIVKS